MTFYKIIYLFICVCVCMCLSCTDIDFVGGNSSSVESSPCSTLRSTTCPAYTKTNTLSPIMNNALHDVATDTSGRFAANILVVNIKAWVHMKAGAVIAMKVLNVEQL